VRPRSSGGKEDRGRTCVSVTFFSKILDPLVAKIGGKQVNKTNFGFLLVELMFVQLLWQHE